MSMLAYTNDRNIKSAFKKIKQQNTRKLLSL